jgi:hypothetical protein
VLNRVLAVPDRARLAAAADLTRALAIDDPSSIGVRTFHPQARNAISVSVCVDARLGHPSALRSG